MPFFRVAHAVVVGLCFRLKEAPTKITEVRVDGSIMKLLCLRTERIPYLLLPSPLFLQKAPENCQNRIYIEAGWQF